MCVFNYFILKNIVQHLNAFLTLCIVNKEKCNLHLTELQEL